MHQDNKILISAILILGIALFSFNFGGLTGRVGAGNVDCQPISVSATKSDVWVNMRIDIPSNAPSTSYNGIEDQEVIVRRNSGEKIADQRIPKEVLSDNPMIFRFKSPIDSGFAGVRDRCTDTEIKDKF